MAGACVTRRFVRAAEGKFWEITSDGPEVEIVAGTLPSAGRARSHRFESVGERDRFVVGHVAKKLEQGFEEVAVGGEVEPEQRLFSWDGLTPRVLSITLRGTALSETVARLDVEYRSVVDDLQQGATTTREHAPIAAAREALQERIAALRSGGWRAFEREPSLVLQPLPAQLLELTRPALLPVRDGDGRGGRFGGRPRLASSWPRCPTCDGLLAFVDPGVPSTMSRAKGSSPRVRCASCTTAGRSAALAQLVDPVGRRDAELPDVSHADDVSLPAVRRPGQRLVLGTRQRLPVRLRLRVRTCPRARGVNANIKFPRASLRVANAAQS